MRPPAAHAAAGGPYAAAMTFPLAAPPGLALGRTVLAASLLLLAPGQDPAPAEATARGSLAARAQEFLRGLAPAQRELAAAPLASPARTEWGFVPRRYPGVGFGDLDEGQMQRARALLAAALSAQGLGKVEAIVALEEVLRELESTPERPAAHRDPARYWLQVFGTPRPEGGWAFRLQGHHVSLHFAVVDDRLVAATPMFLGANPHEIRRGPRRGERVLAREEDLARGLLALLGDRQLDAAVIAATAPRDVFLGPDRAAGWLGAPRGIAHRDLDALQQGMLWRLIEEYVHNRRGPAAARELARIDAAGRDAIHFAWAGSTRRGQGHYYRIHGPTFVIEYDNTQDDANHVHTVYRDLEHDFGVDLLREHYEHGHGHGR